MTALKKVLIQDTVIVTDTIKVSMIGATYRFWKDKKLLGIINFLFSIAIIIPSSFFSITLGIIIGIVWFFISWLLPMASPPIRNKYQNK